MLKLQFGLALDGARSTPAATAVGQVALGPLGLLVQLELYLGLVRPEVTQAQRSIQYRAYLKQHLVDEPAAFYAASFRNDEVGVASRLLSWRDQWYEYGWSGGPSPFLSGRSKTLAEVERLARGRIAPGLAERLKAVEERLSMDHPVPIESIHCEDLWSHLSPRWQAVFSHLPVEYPALTPHGRSGSRLKAVQQALLTPEDSEAPMTADDGSVLLVRCGPRMLSGAWLAGLLASPRDRLLLVENDAQSLDDLLHANGLPALGFADTSALRPALQVLPLALQQLWAPADIPGLLTFLTHAICPIRGIARNRLAEDLAQKPGLDRARLDRILTKVRASIEEANQALADGRRAIDPDKTLDEAIYWLFSDRFDPNLGAPINEVTERVRRLAEFFRGRMAIERGEATDSQSDGAAHAQCQTLLYSLGQLIEQSETHIQPRALQKLIRQASARGARAPGRHPEVGACRIASDPAEVVAPVDEVIAWSLQAPRRPPPQPWTQRERTELLKAGINLPTDAERLLQQQYSMLRPFLMARERLVLVVSAEGSEAHPLVQQVQKRFRDQTVHELADLIHSPDAHAAGEISVETIRHQPLPRLKNVWKLPAGTVPFARISKDSFSSLELYLGAPHRWVLKYPARLRPSQVLEMSDGPLLLGNLLHRVVENLVKAHPDILGYEPQRLTDLALEELDRVIAMEASLLLGQGRGNQLGRLRVLTARAFERLWDAFRSAGVVAITAEQTLEGRFGDEIELGGSADLVVTRADGAKAVVDMKWGSADKRAKQLKSNQHLQLALYSGLVADVGTALWPEVAYYILSKQRLLAQDQGFFAEAEAHTAKSPLTSIEFWQAAEWTWRWRRDQLKEGRIAICSSELGAESDSASSFAPLPDGAYDPPVPDESYDDYRFLKGWTA